MGVHTTGAKIVGVLNVTPDSFFHQSRVQTEQEVSRFAQQMIAAGVDVLEVGGESTRPGSRPVSENEELDRVMPAINALREITDLPVSVDTRKSMVVREALAQGVQIINDISALRDDPAMISLIVRHEASVVLMHMKGAPQTMQDHPQYDDVVREIAEFLRSRADFAMKSGIPAEHIILDPGIGFGKTFEDNVTILHHLSEFQELGFPLMIGLSRKQFIGNILRNAEGLLPVQERLAGTLGGIAWCITQGMDYIRVHDVRETNHLMRVMVEIMNAR